MRELKKLHAIGVIRARRAGREKHYRLNEEFHLYEDLAAVFAKTRKQRRYALQDLKFYT